MYSGVPSGDTIINSLNRRKEGKKGGREGRKKGGTDGSKKGEREGKKLRKKKTKRNANTNENGCHGVLAIQLEKTAEGRRFCQALFRFRHPCANMYRKDNKDLGAAVRRPVEIKVLFPE